MSNDNIGTVYGDIKIIKLLNTKNNSKTYLCKCIVCGREKTTQLKHLKKGLGISHKNCGLGMKQKDKRFYQIWSDMRKRTTNEKSNVWENYGGRGITSEQYKYFIDFYDDMYKSYIEHVKKYGKKNTTIDRIDTNGNYCYENLRWATRKEQEDNRRIHEILKVAISPEGKKYTFNNIKDFCTEHNELYKENVSAVLRKVQKTHKGWRFYYEES